MTTIGDVVQRSVSAWGTPYVFGAKGPPPNPIDCSGFVRWACESTGVDMPDGSWNQLAHCRAAGLAVTIAQGIATYGALLFMGTDGAEHVAFSLGNGMTSEARGRAYGSGSWQSTGRPWSAAALIPGVDYGAPHPGDEYMPLPDIPDGPPGAKMEAIGRLLDALDRSRHRDDASAWIEDYRRLKNLEAVILGGAPSDLTQRLDQLKADVDAIKAKVGA